MLDANFWQNKNSTKKIIKEKKFYEDLINSLNDSIQKLKDLDDLNELALEEGNVTVQNETLQNIESSLAGSGKAKPYKSPPSMGGGKMSATPDDIWNSSKVDSAKRLILMYPISPVSM